MASNPQAIVACQSFKKLTGGIPTMKDQDLWSETAISVTVLGHVKAFKAEGLLAMALSQVAENWVFPGHNALGPGHNQSRSCRNFWQLSCRGKCSPCLAQRGAGVYWIDRLTSHT